MQTGRPTLSEFLSQQLGDDATHADLRALLLDLAAAIKEVAAMTTQGALAGVLGSLSSHNIQGETQKKLDVLANDAFLRTLERGGLVAGVASEENDEPIFFPEASAEDRAHFLVLFDPLDGSSNIDVNVSVGSIFSILRAPSGRSLSVGDFLQPGREQIAAGYAAYGPSTMLVLTVLRGTHAFTLDSGSKEFLLTHPNLQIPKDTSEFAINASNERFWEPPVARYISECKAGKTGERQRDFNMRWIASMVADVHRILMRGGIFLYPKDTKDPAKPGRLRLMYEANPMSLLVEQAGGAASTGRARLLDVQPEQVHQRIPVILGSAHEVERVAALHQALP